MAVRFRPDPSERSTPKDRENIAEVIDIRSRLVSDAVESMDTLESSTSSSVMRPPASVLADLREDGVRLLARKALSSGELRTQLRGRDHAEHDVEDLIQEFQDGFYLDDVGLARTLTEKLRSTKRASRAQIRRKLAERLIERSVIDEVVSTLDDETEDEILNETARERARRLVSLERPVAERRLMGYLARRGWSGSEALRAARAALDDAFTTDE